MCFYSLDEVVFVCCFLFSCLLLFYDVAWVFFSFCVCVGGGVGEGCLCVRSYFILFFVVVLFYYRCILFLILNVCVYNGFLTCYMLGLFL